MNHLQHPKLAAAFILAAAFLLTSTGLHAADRTQMRREARAALNRLYAEHPAARQLGDSAAGILVFPGIVKAGLVIGGQQGDGTLFRQGNAVAYYKSLAASYGLQAGVQKFSYVLFFMKAEDLAYLRKSEGWEIGTGPSIVLVDKGMAKTLSSTTLRKGVYTFIFGQKGLMAGVGLQGTKITPINPR